MSRSCKQCLFLGLSEITSSDVCDYPIPAWVQIRTSGGNFISGYEAETCPLFKTKNDLVAEVKVVKS